VLIRGRSWYAIGGAIALSATLAACGGSSSSNGTSGGSGYSGAALGNGSGSSSTFTIDSSVAPSTLDPAEGCGLPDLAVISNLYMRLTQYGTKAGPDGTQEINPVDIKPWAAKSWTTSDGGTTYTFTLKPGLKFPDGTPVTSKDVAYSINRTTTVNGCGLFFVQDGFSNPSLIKSIATPNPTTVVFNLTQPDNDFPQAMAQPAAGIVEPSIVQAHGGVKKNAVNQYMASHQAGGGPFVLQSYQPNQSVTLTANPHYAAGPAPASKKVVFTFVDSDPTLLLDAKSGDADAVLGLSPQSVSSLKSDANVKIVADTTPTSEQIGLPNDKAPFNNKLVREALTYAIPYQQVIDKVAFGYGTAYYGPLQPLLADYDASLSAPRPFDMAKAKALIKQSGIKTPVNVTMVVQAGNSTDQQIATLAAGEWSQLGIKVHVQTMSPTAYINALEGHKVQSYVRLDGPGVLDPGYYLAYDMACGVSFNLSAICIPPADKLLDAARKTSSSAARKQDYAQITKLWVADSPKIEVFAPQFVAVLKKNVTGYLYSHELDVRTWAAK
jgi:peptide/nickel transport system substrate-binding protein